MKTVMLFSLFLLSLFLGSALEAGDSPRREKKKVVELPLATINNDSSDREGKEFVRFVITLSEVSPRKAELSNSVSSDVSDECDCLTPIERLLKDLDNPEDANKLYKDGVACGVITPEMIVAILRRSFGIEVETTPQ